MRFKRLTVDLADARDIDPDLTRPDEEPWRRRAKRGLSPGLSTRPILQAATIVGLAPSVQ